MQALRYLSPQDSLSMRPNSRALATDLLLTLWHRPRCFKCHQSHTPHHCQPQTWDPAVYHSLIPSSWYFVLTGIRKKLCESSISWAIWAYKLVCLLSVTLKKDQKTRLLACNSTWFWGICYSARFCRLWHSFEAWHLNHLLASEAFIRSGSSIGRRSSIFGTRRIIFPRILTLSWDWDLPHRKRKGDICNWAQKVYN